MTDPLMWITPKEAQHRAGFGKTKVAALIRSGALKSTRVGGSRRIRLSDFEEFMNGGAGMRRG